MQAVIFIGIQGAGKSTFYAQRFAQTHLRLNLDMLRTRRREAILVEACLKAGQRFVIDNTNPTVADRARYIRGAQAHHFDVIGYYFVDPVERCIERNAHRQGRAAVPARAIRATWRKMQPPRHLEGFKTLYRVLSAGENAFSVEEIPPPEPVHEPMRKR